MKLSWCTIHVHDMEQSKSFYGKFLGLRKTRSFSPQKGTEIVFFSDKDSIEIELIHNEKAPLSEGTCRVSLGLRTKNFDELLVKAKEGGFSLSGPLILGEDMECFFLQDPDGVGIQMIRDETVI